MLDLLLLYLQLLHRLLTPRVPVGSSFDIIYEPYKCREPCNHKHKCWHHIQHDIYNHVLLILRNRCYFQVLLYFDGWDHSHLRLLILAWFYLSQTHNISFLRLIVCMFWLVKVFVSERSCQLVTEVDYTWLPVYKLPDTLDEYITWLMGYLGMMSGILLKLGSFSIYPLFVLTVVMFEITQ